MLKTISYQKLQTLTCTIMKRPVPGASGASSELTAAQRHGCRSLTFLIKIWMWLRRSIPKLQFQAESVQHPFSVYTGLHQLSMPAVLFNCSTGPKKDWTPRGLGAPARARVLRNKITLDDRVIRQGRRGRSRRI